MNTPLPPLLIGPYMQRNSMETENLVSAARALVEKLGTLPWRDRDICYDEWSALVDALNSGTMTDGKRYTRGKLCGDPAK